MPQPWVTRNTRNPRIILIVRVVLGISAFDELLSIIRPLPIFDADHVIPALFVALNDAGFYAAACMAPRLDVIVTIRAMHENKDAAIPHCDLPPPAVSQLKNSAFSTSAKVLRTLDDVFGRAILIKIEPAEHWRYMLGIWINRISST